ncbi:MAG: maleylpyruvate isomerase family mycothiol-dependent enzyme [Acidimicrobiales bacterium]|jgi:uncharacterized protein (TIGR03083 family)
MAYEWITDALEETWLTIDRVVRLQPADAYNAQTACPGWDVRDVLSHLLGFEMMIQGSPVPAYEGPWPDYVRNPIGEINECFVQAYRAEAGIEVLNKFRDVAATAIRTLRSLDDDAWEKVGWSPEGERPYHRFQETRVLDSWIHLQDIRDALLEPADDHGAAEEIVINRFEGALPFIIGKKMGAHEGTVIHINLTGRLARTIVLAVENARAVVVHDGDLVPTLEFTTPVALFWRRAAGRISAPAFLNASATDVRGDHDLAEHFAEALTILL